MALKEYKPGGAFTGRVKAPSANRSLPGPRLCARRRTRQTRSSSCSTTQVSGSSVVTDRRSIRRTLTGSINENKFFN
jgi:hypothetical protein